MVLLSTRIGFLIVEGEKIECNTVCFWNLFSDVYYDLRLKSRTCHD